MSRGSAAAAVAGLSDECGACAGHLLTPIPLMGEPVDAARASMDSATAVVRGVPP